MSGVPENGLPKRVLVIAGYGRSLLHFRGPLLQAMRDAGHQVVAVAPQYDLMAQESADDIAEGLAKLGVHYRPIRMSRTGMNPRHDLTTLRELRALMDELRPDVVFSYTIKAVIYGSLAARMGGVPHTAAMVTGLGYAFTGGEGDLKKRAVQLGVQQLYKRAFAACDRVIFQNPDDRDELVGLGLLPQSKTALVNGSGLSLSHYAPKPLPAEPKFLMIARLTPEKGVAEYAAAAQELGPQLPGTTFGLLGPLDYSPGAFTEADIARWETGGLTYLGETKDVRPYLEDANIFVLPSYREGTPRTVLEAMAMGRPVITTDAPGCRETVEEGMNGFLVPVKDSRALAARMLELAQSPELRERMGAAGRVRAVERYDVDGVNTRMLELLGLDGEVRETAPAKAHRSVDVFKRGIDIAISGAALILGALPLVGLGLLVHLRLGSPILFTQTRPGRYGQPFKMYKFRTMTDERGQNGELLPDADRLTPFGQFLRSTSLDELPELWNVLKGEMSLVGPRPLLMSYLPLYSPEQARRHEVKPGVTGWAQVNGRNTLSWDKKFEYDVWYVDHRSLTLDFRIFLMTLLKVIKRDGISANGEATMKEFRGNDAGA